MASPLELLGLQQGLGPAITGMQAFEQNDAANQSALADALFKQQQTRNAALTNELGQIELQEARQLSPSKVQAGIAGNQMKVGEAGVAQQQQMAEMIVGIGNQLERFPAQQRTQLMQALAQRVPTIMKDPTFQMLMQTDPNQLPTALKQVGTSMLLNTGDQQRKQALQTQAEDARMTQERLSQGAATARQQMGDDAAMRRLQETIAANTLRDREAIEAGKYRDKRAQNDPATLISKMGFEKAAVYYNELARTEKDPAVKQEYKDLSDQMRQMNIDQKIAAVKPGSTIDPSTGQIVPQMPVGATGQMPPPSRGAVPPGLPPGTVNNGDGTFTLPDGRRGRFK